MMRSSFLASLFFVFFLLGSSNVFAYQIGGGGSDGKGCDQRTIEVCIVDECGNDLILPYEILSELNIILNNNTPLNPIVQLPGENGCVILEYFLPYNVPVYNLRVAWNFQLDRCPEGDLDCDPTSEEYAWGEDNVNITSPRCHESIVMTLSNYTKRNQFFLRTDDCERRSLNRRRHTVEICDDAPTLFLEVNPSFLGTYQMGIEIVDNQTDDNGNQPVLENRMIPCFDGAPGSQVGLNGLFGIGSFDCGVDEEGNPITEFAYGIDLTDYLTADPTCEEPSSITLTISLYCCGDNESFVDLSYTFIWQPDVQVPDPLFYFITENNVIEAMNDGTKYDNGIAGDDLLLNADSDPESYTGDGPTLGTLTAGLGFDGSILNPDCVQKYEIELFEFLDCGIEDWNQASPITVDHDQDPATPEISRFDITSEVTANGYDALFMTLAVDPVFGESLFQLSKNTCYYAKVIMTTQCEVIERYGRFETANCNFCREVVEQDEREIRIYPTIVEHELTIGSNVDYPETVDINIYDASGRTALQTKHQNQGRFLNVNTSSLQPGLHFIEIIIGDESHVHKILVQ